jgi:phosphatase NudJ
MAHEPIPTRFFVGVAVRCGHRWLLVHETSHGQRWCFPTGRVEPGETFLEAARRETLEETGIPIEFEGVVRIEHTPQPDGTARVRVILLAHPSDDTPPKQQPDGESLEAGWFSLEQMVKLPLRSAEVPVLFAYLSGAPVIAPLAILSEDEGEFE